MDFRRSLVNFFVFKIKLFFEVGKELSFLNGTMNNKGLFSPPKNGVLKRTFVSLLVKNYAVNMKV